MTKTIAVGWKAQKHNGNMVTLEIRAKPVCKKDNLYVLNVLFVLTPLDTVLKDKNL